MTKTMTAEEVEQWRDAVRNAIYGELRAGDTETVLTACARIAAQAARVPELEEEVDNLKTAVAGADNLWEQQQARAEQAESERDLAKIRLERDGGRLADEVAVLVRQRVVDQRSPVADALLDFRDPPTSERADRLVTLESERDAAQGEVASLTEENGAIRSKNEELGQENATLRERVATLEREVREQDDARLATECDLTTAGISVDDGLHDAVHVLIAKCDTAEARAKELEDAIRVLNAHIDFTSPWEPGDLDVEDPSGINAAMAHLHALTSGASQPPPALAQGNKRAARHLRDAAFTHPIGGTIRGVLEVMAREVETLDPTPPPGLREAAEGVSIARQLRRVADATKEPRVVVVDQSKATELVRLLDVARAAYDATGGEAPTPASSGGDWYCPACQAAISSAQVTHQERHENCGTPVTWVEAGEDIDAMRADAAKYRAAVEMAKDKESMARALYSAVRGKTMRWEDATGMVRYDAEEAAIAVAQHLLGLTLDTPPSGPGGGEDWPLPPHDRCEMKCLVGRPQECAGPEMAGIRDGVRARITPTPTPEVPSLKDECTAPEKRGCLAGDHVWWDDGESCACRATKRPVPDAIQPTTPAVMWEGDGMTVFVDGRLKGAGFHAPDYVGIALARALAEAKREASEMRKAHEAVQYAANNESWATAGGDVIAIHSARLEGDTAETAKKAAESMRERAATAAGTARHSVVVDESFATYAKACDDIMQRILKLPLE